MKVFLIAFLTSVMSIACYRDSGPERNAIEMLPFYYWNVSKVWTNTTNYTNLYPTINIVFGLDGTVEARTFDRSANTTVILQTGTWSSINSSKVLLLKISFPSPTNYGELNNTWIATKLQEGVVILRKQDNLTESLMLVDDN